MQKNPLIGGLLKMKKLWDNPDTSSDFNPSQITIDQAESDLLLYLFYESKTNQRVVSVIAPVGQTAKACNVGWTSANKMVTSTRFANYVDSTHLSLGNAYYNVTTSDVGTNNSYLIPYQIYGIKIG